MGLDVGEVDGVCVFCLMCNWLDIYTYDNMANHDLYMCPQFCFPHLCRLC